MEPTITETMEEVISEQNEKEFRDGARSNQYKGRSLVAGTSFGCIEVGMRLQNGDYYCVHASDLDIVDFIHILGHTVGQEVSLKPRKLISSEQK